MFEKLQQTASHEKKRELMDGLERKVLLGTNFLTKTQKLATADPKIVPDEFAQIREQTIAEFPSDIVEKYHALITLREESDKLDQELETLEENSQDWERVERKIGEVEEQRSKLLENNDVQFLGSFLDGISMLEDKFDFLQGATPAQLTEDALLESAPHSESLGEEHSDKVGDPSIVYEVETDNFSAIVKIGHEEYAKRFPGSDGFHIALTPYCYVDAGRTIEDQFKTIRHERVHNMLDGFVSQVGVRSSDYVGGLLKTRELSPEFYSMRYGSVTVEEVVEKAINNLKGELLAEFEELFDRNFNVSGDLTGNSRMPSMVTQFGQALKAGEKVGEKTQLARMSRAWSTAGFDTLNTIKTLKSYGSSINDGTAIMARDILQKFEKRAFIVMSTMKESAVVASILDREGMERAEVLFAILSPSRYRHVPNYLQYHYGKEQYEQARSCAEIFIGGNFSSELLRKYVDEVQNGRFFTNAKMAAMLSGHLKKGNMQLSEIKDEKDYIKYRDVLFQLGAIFTEENEYTKELTTGMLGDYLEYKVIREGNLDRVSLFNKLWNVLNKNERKAIILDTGIDDPDVLENEGWTEKEIAAIQDIIKT